MVDWRKLDLGQTVYYRQTEFDGSWNIECEVIGLEDDCVVVADKLGIEYTIEDCNAGMFYLN